MTRAWKTPSLAGLLLGASGCWLANDFDFGHADLAAQSGDLATTDAGIASDLAVGCTTRPTFSWMQETSDYPTTIVRHQVVATSSHRLVVLGGCQIPSCSLASDGAGVREMLRDTSVGAGSALTWPTLAALTNPRDSAGAVARGATAVIAGGEPQSDALQYTVDGNASEQFTAPWHGRVLLGVSGVLADDGRVFMIGGAEDGMPIDQVASLGPATSPWLVSGQPGGPPMLTTARSAAAAVSFKGMLWALGGLSLVGSSLVATPTVEVLDPVAGGVWVSGPPMLHARAALGAVTAPDGRLYAIGGLDSNEVPQADVSVLDACTGAWQDIAPLPSARAAVPAVIGPDNRIYVVGGLTDAETPSATVFALGPRLYTQVDAHGDLAITTDATSPGFPPHATVSVAMENSSTPLATATTDAAGRLPTMGSAGALLVPGASAGTVYLVEDDQTLYPLRIVAP